MSNLNFKEVQDLESRFEHLTGGAEDLSDVERAVRLGKYEKLIVDLHDRGSIDPALLEHLLQFGTVIRRTHEPDLLSVALVFSNYWLTSIHQIKSMEFLQGQDGYSKVGAAALL